MKNRQYWLTALAVGLLVSVTAAAQESDGDRANATPAAGCSALLPRPRLSGPESVLESEPFVIHYTEAGADRVTPGDADAVQAILDAVIQRQVVEMGWPMPPGDCGEGGDARFDVYLAEARSAEDEGEVVGYTIAQGVVGDNPNTPEGELYAAYSYLVLDSDFVAAGEVSRSLVRATAAHEFHHAIQNGYDLNDPLAWYYEATSTWMEVQTFPQDQDAVRYVPVLFYYPDICIGGGAAQRGGQDRIYAEWLLLDSIAQDFGPEAVRRLWQYVAADEGMAAFYHLLDDLDTTPQAVIERFAIRNLLLDYPLSEDFETQVRVEAAITSVGMIYPQQTGVQELGVDYVRVAEPGVYTLSANLPNLSLVVVGIDRNTDTAHIFELGAQGIVDTRPFSDAYVLILNTAVHEDPERCTWAGWALTVADGSAQTPAAPLDEAFDASFFVPPG